MSDGGRYVETLRELRVRRVRNNLRCQQLRCSIVRNCESIKEQLTFMALLTGKVKEFFPYIKQLFFH